MLGDPMPEGTVPPPQARGPGSRFPGPPARCQRLSPAFPSTCVLSSRLTPWLLQWPCCLVPSYFGCTMASPGLPSHLHCTRRPWPSPPHCACPALSPSTPAPEPTGRPLLCPLPSPASSGPVDSCVSERISERVRWTTRVSYSTESAFMKK